MSSYVQRPQRRVYMHLGSDELADDGETLVGVISHYARASDAAKCRKFVKSCVVSTYEVRDFLGELYETAVTHSKGGFA